MATNRRVCAFVVASAIVCVTSNVLLCKSLGTADDGVLDSIMPPVKADDGDERSDIAETPSLQPDGLRHDYRNSLSACLLWMDDYHRLVEWIAYHYYSLSLRTLVIRRDPRSTQDLAPLLQRWDRLINITVWHELSSHMSRTRRRKLFRRKLEADSKNAANEAVRRERQFELTLFEQREFYRSCARHLQQHNRTWTLFADTDEFVVLDSRYVPNAAYLTTLPGAVFRTLQYLQWRNLTDGADRYEQPCIPVARIQYGAVESPVEQVRRDVPGGIDPYRFQTLRFRHSEQTTYIGKTVADVSRLEIDDRSRMSAHVFLTEKCPDAWTTDDAILRVEHYIGSYEMFVRPNDRREWENRTEKWLRDGSKSLQDPGPPAGDESRGWIRGFVECFGNETAGYLLDDAGFGYNATTAMRTLSPACGMNCVETYQPDGSLLGKIDLSRTGASKHIDEARGKTGDTIHADLHRSMSLQEFVEADAKQLCVQ